MATINQPSKRKQSSIKYRCVPLEISSFKISDIGREEDLLVQNHEHSEPRFSTKILCRNQLVVSAVEGLWNSISQPFTISQPQECGNSSYTDKLLIKDNEGNDVLVSSDSENFCRDLKSVHVLFSTVNPDFKNLKKKKSMLLFDPCSRSNGNSFWSYMQVIKSHMPVEPWRTINVLESTKFSCDLAVISELISKNSSGFKEPIDVSIVKISAENCSLESLQSPAEISVEGIRDIKPNHFSKLSDCEDPMSRNARRLTENIQPSVVSLCSTYLLGASSNLEVCTNSDLSSSSLLTDYHVKFGEGQLLPKPCHVVLETLEDLSVSQEEKERDEDSNQQLKELAIEDKPSSKLYLPIIHEKVKNALDKQGNALAGALAGIFVSLWLHPVDTIKTVVQVRGREQKSVCHMFGSIISERGFTGLYRGIGSNIASSAPISAVYTFTYESVKEALLPFLPKEYYSFAHCTAGGCASIATSFIFTPSERIKQQMQIGSRYQNCWNALTGIIEKGGLPSLYAGWGAVLCRNIPHSIIKFYTYERLKQWLLSCQQSDGHLSTLQTLVCGGLAGSTAAVFTTPFDVVKTRLQTQIPGSLKQYDGVIHTLQEIAMEAGLKGLYRGLTPRLIIYMSQGALFFASYEFFKKVFSLEVKRLPAQASKVRYTEESSTSGLM